MIVQRFDDARLAQASCLVGCGRTGEAIVIDPNRDAGQYVRAAEGFTNVIILTGGFTAREQCGQAMARSDGSG